MDVVDDNSSRLNFVGSWSTDHITGALDGTVHTTSDPDAYVTLQFTGSYIELDALKSTNGANFTVKLDGSTYGPYSLYSSSTSVSNVWSQQNLNPTATHTIEVHRAGATPGANGAVEINVDAFQISTSSASVGSPDGITKTSTTTSSSSSTSTSRSTTPSSTSHTSTRSNSTTTHSSTSNSTTLHTSTIPITRTSTLSTHSTSSSSPIAASDITTSGSQKTGIVLGSVVAVIIGVCLLTIPIVWIKRRRAKSQAEFLRASTTPAYQTTTVTRGLAPPILSSFNRSSGNTGSNSNVGYQPSPIARTAETNSPFSDEYAQPMTAEGQYYIFPATPPPASHPRQRYTESTSSDYPYPLAYNSRDPHNRDPSPYSGSS